MSLETVANPKKVQFRGYHFEGWRPRRPSYQCFSLSGVRRSVCTYSFFHSRRQALHSIYPHSPSSIFPILITMSVLLLSALSNFFGDLSSKMNLTYPRTPHHRSRSPQGRSHSCPPPSPPPSPQSLPSIAPPSDPSIANLMVLLRQVESTRSQVKCCLTCSSSSSQNYSGISIYCSREICPIYGAISYLRYRILQAKRRRVQRRRAMNTNTSILLIPAISNYLPAVIYGCAKRIVQFVCGAPIQIPNYSALRYYAEVGIHHPTSEPVPNQTARRNHSSYY